MTERTESEAVADVTAIRQDFPALKRRHAGRPVAYFDGPGGTQVPSAVPAAMERYLLRHNANTGWAYPASRETDEAIAEGRRAIADFLGAAPSEIAFGASMTTLTFHLSRALGRGWGEGDEVVVTELDHLANVAPWEALARERGVRLRSVPMLPADGTLDWEALEEALTERTRLLAIGAASNALGTINDLARAERLARERGCLLFVDAVHYAPHERVDVARIGCDFLACSPYKFYGPHLGVLFAREELIRELDVPRLACAPNRAPERLETGTLNHEGIAGAAAAVDYLASLAGGSDRRARLTSAFRALRGRGERLFARLWEGLAAVPGVRTFGPPPDRPRTPTVAFRVRDLPSRAVAARLASEFGVFCSHGDFYASGVTRRLGLAEQGLVRAGCACYTTEEEVGRLLEGVERVASGD